MRAGPYNSGRAQIQPVGIVEVTRMRLFLLVAMFGGCGGSVDWVGNWQSAPSPPGSYVAMTLTQVAVPGGEALGGNGTKYREAGSPVTFQVSGDVSQPNPLLTFTYPDNSNEALRYAQPDKNHITLKTLDNSTLNFTRQ